MIDSIQGSRVLLVDDDHDVLGANSRFLRLNGVDVVIADCASRALQVLADETVELVITDLRMPECDGLSFARQARAIIPLMPIVFFSGFARVPDIVAAMRLGAVDFLEKPVEPAEMLQKIAEILGPKNSATSMQRMAFDVLDSDAPFRQRVLAYEKYLIESCLLQHNGKIGAVLDAMQINRRTLNDKMSKLGISRRHTDEQDN